MNKQEIVETLSNHPFLSGLSKTQLALLAPFTQQITLTADQFLGRERELATAFYLIQSGRVAIELRKSGRSPVRVQILRRGDSVGWSWLVPPHRWQFDVRVLDTVQALAFDAEALRQQCEADHELGYQLLKRLITVVGGRLAATQRQLLDQHE
jgi:CRP/FNR family transcriptional regulator, cyclic AMP receptor protein